ncbi:hypothetical protein Tco_1259082, partial [Tanacetum coccineum]
AGYSLHDSPKALKIYGFVRSDGNHITFTHTFNHRRGRCSSSSRYALRSGRELINGGLNLDNSATVADLQNAIHHKRDFGFAWLKRLLQLTLKPPNVKHLRSGTDVTKVLEPSSPLCSRH